MVRLRSISVTFNGESVSQPSVCLHYLRCISGLPPWLPEEFFVLPPLCQVVPPVLFPYPKLKQIRPHAFSFLSKFLEDEGFVS